MQTIEDKLKALDFVLIKGTPHNTPFQTRGASLNNKRSFQPLYIPIRDFYINKYLVTQKLYAKIVSQSDYYTEKHLKLNPRPANFQGDKQPVENVSWFDCAHFCNAYSRFLSLPEVYEFRDGNKITINPSCRGIRMPTDVEWEYAARGGSNWNEGDINEDNIWAGTQNENELTKFAWYNKNSPNHTLAVGLKLPNKAGIYDMSGNVSEWTNQTIEDIDTFFLRGGDIFSDSDVIKTIYRFDTLPSERMGYNGFRLVYPYPKRHALDSSFVMR